MVRPVAAGTHEVGDGKGSSGMEQTARHWQYWFADESGGSLVEYVMLASLIAMVCVGALTLIGKSIQGKLEAPRAALDQ